MQKYAKIKFSPSDSKLLWFVKISDENPKMLKVKICVIA